MRGNGERTRLESRSRTTSAAAARRPREQGRMGRIGRRKAEGDETGRIKRANSLVGTSGDAWSTRSGRGIRQILVAMCKE
eukprot:4218735-Pyramimonas_sp.AAC.1